ncbi:unnamed protein product [Lactuca virosa]|uniref:Uncharacterized protein n=1 Tax=Lactuca virosa TaxID=75947 RepID=A0AAU9PRL0_9ASTR|nr:unnamed protein product [Lactuca virosa]
MAEALRYALAAQIGLVLILNILYWSYMHKGTYSSLVLNHAYDSSAFTQMIINDVKDKAKGSASETDAPAPQNKGNRKAGKSNDSSKKKDGAQEKQAKLKMEGFVLPYSESTRILKDKEVICVKRKEMALNEAIEKAYVDNLVDYAEVNRKEPLPQNVGAQGVNIFQQMWNELNKHLLHLMRLKRALVELLEGKKAKKQRKQELAKISQKMEGFVLPPYDSTRILKDMEVLGWTYVCYFSVKRQEVALNEAIKGADAGDLHDYVEVNRNESVKSEPLQENVQRDEQASTTHDGAKKILEIREGGGRT